MDLSNYLIFGRTGSMRPGGLEGREKGGLGRFWGSGGLFYDFGALNFGSSSQVAYFCRPKNVEFMANHKATKKDVRQAEKRRDRNRYYGKTTRNAIRDLREIKVQKEAGEKLPEIASMIDKLAKKGIIHKNKAANLKRKLARRVNTLGATATAAK